jgi:hypothetical protein
LSKISTDEFGVPFLGFGTDVLVVWLEVGVTSIILPLLDVNVCFGILPMPYVVKLIHSIKK